jgi:prepilin-type N-terminal cleavage/methylation domain-containing protein
MTRLTSPPGVTPSAGRRRAHPAAPARRGFTLVELGVVMLIIGLLLGFVLVASNQALEASRLKATQALIAKLEIGVTERMEIITRESAPVNLAHRHLSRLQGPVYAGGFSAPDERRAQVIANADRIRAEMPDSFFVQAIPPAGDRTSIVYPLNFAGLPAGFTGNIIVGMTPAGFLPPVSVPSTPYTLAHYILPYGNSILFDPPNNSFGAVPVIGGNPQAPEGYSATGTGIFGASYSVAASVYKNLGYAPTGYDGIDNNFNGYIDEWAEGVASLSDADLEKVRQNLNNHTLSPKTIRTARSEMLYALLIEGRGAAGPVFSVDDFPATQIRDTDGDGLPEFVDAYGEPIQFFRWPTHYPSDIQKGWRPYAPRGTPDGTEQREISPLDPNGLLIQPAWWGDITALGTISPMSQNALIFQSHFFSLIDPSATGGVDIQPTFTAPPGAPGEQYTLWDRTGFYKRRSFFSKPLILSAGADKELGVPLMGVPYPTMGDTDADVIEKPIKGRSPLEVALDLVLIENQAAPYRLLRQVGTYAPAVLNPGGLSQRPDLSLVVWDPYRGYTIQLGGSSQGDAIYQLLYEAGADDITNHTLSSAGTGGAR